MSFEIETKNFKRTIKVDAEKLREDVKSEREVKTECFRGYLNSLTEKKEAQKKKIEDLLERGRKQEEERAKAEAIMKAEAEAEEMKINAENYGKDEIREALKRTMRGEFFNDQEKQQREKLDKLKEGYGEGAKRKALKDLLSNLTK